MCLIFLAGTDIIFQWPSWMRSRGDTSFTTPRRGLSQTRRSMSCIRPFRRSTRCIHPFRRRPSPPGVKGLPLDGGGTFLFHVGGIQDVGVRFQLPLRPMDTPVLPGSRRLLGTAVDKPNLGQKPKLGGVHVLLPFPLYLPLVRFYFFVVFACSSLFF